MYERGRARLHDGRQRGVQVALLRRGRVEHLHGELPPLRARAERRRLLAWRGPPAEQRAPQLSKARSSACAAVLERRSGALSQGALAGRRSARGARRSHAVLTRAGRAGAGSESQQIAASG